MNPVALLGYWREALIAALLVAAGLQTIRLAEAEADKARLEAAADKGRADRADAARKDSDEKAGKESTHANDTQAAVDKFIAQGPDRAVGLQRELAAADRLRRDAESRAATARAQAAANGVAAVGAQDRIAVLETNAAEGLRVVAEHREALGRRDAEVELLCGVVNADRRLMDSAPGACTGP